MNLNLARKWRSKNFDQIIGQAMSVRMLKNSLYLQQLFPVYLFSGQHGCGKTSTARIFAAAVNCTNLEQFRVTPRSHPLPCGLCTSCQAMTQTNHPDFYEIDAASHTGVDTIRQIIEAATLLPLLGAKKIYLIDEAHMLSKAAFNALLKILEEPPTSVLFILATTDEQKIPETVQSRCFKLFFTPIKQATLVDHLAYICTQEKISNQRSALELIAQESTGSVRDALNVLEQVRFSSSMITPHAVMQILGRIDDSSLLRILELVAHGNVQLLLHYLHTIKWYEYKAELLWKRLLSALRALIWAKYGITAEHMLQSAQHITLLAHQMSLPFLYNVMNTLYTHEQLFMRTTSQHELLEVILLQLCHKKGNHEGESGAMQSISRTSIMHEESSFDNDKVEQDQNKDDVCTTTPPCYRTYWSQFMHSVEQLDEQLFISIMKQTEFIVFDVVLRQVKAQCSQGGAFFKGIVDETQQLWQPILNDIFGAHTTLSIDFGPVRYASDRTSTSSKIASIPSSLGTHEGGANKLQKKIPIRESDYRNRYVPDRRAHADYLKQPFSGASESWPITTLLLQHFSGTVYTIHEHR